MGVLAYQIVATIPHQLKINAINDSWQNILMKTNTQKSILTSLLNETNEKIVIKTCSNPSTEGKAIYKALNYKQKPYVRKYIVFPQK